MRRSLVALKTGVLGIVQSLGFCGCLFPKMATKILHTFLLSHFSSVRLFATLRTVALQAPWSMGFSRQEYCSGLPCPPPVGLSDPGIEPMSLMSPAWAVGFFTTSSTWEILPNPGQSLFSLFKTYLLLIWLCQVLVAACGVFDLCCSMRDLVPCPGIDPRPPAL